MHAERHAYGMAGMGHSIKHRVKRSLLKDKSFYYLWKSGLYLTDSVKSGKDFFPLRKSGFDYTDIAKYGGDFFLKSSTLKQPRL